MSGVLFLRTPVDEDGVGITVEITPLPTATCTVDCSAPPGVGPDDPSGGLAVTGGELASIVLAVTLVAAGVTAAAWARWRRPRPAGLTRR